MPETGTLLTPSEEHFVVEFILGRGGFLVPDIDYHSACYYQIVRMEQYSEFRKLARLFFIVHEAFSGVPLEVRSMSKAGQIVYFIMPRNGGPAIAFHPTVEFVEDGVQKVNPGFFAYYKTYWNPEVGENQPSPRSLIDFYAELRSFLRQYARPIKLGKRTYWVGRKMEEELRNGVKALGLRGVMLPPRR